MYNESSSPALSYVTLSGNFAGSGGGMYNESASSPQLSYVTISGNKATNPGSTGAGMYNDASSPQLDHVEISGNIVNGNGAGMYNYNLSSPTLFYVTISGNQAMGSLPNGGGIYNDHSSPVLTDGCVISGNTAGNFGAGMYNSGASSPKMRGSAVIDENNGVYLESGTTITIDGALTPVGGVSAKITPSAPPPAWTGRQVLSGSPGLISANHGKFTVTDNPPGTTWSVASNGMLSSP
jgi:hypothetical protein